MSKEIEIAKVAKRAAQIHEDSWIEEGSFGEYKVKLQEACEIAASEAQRPNLGRIVYLAIETWWNDTLDWADEQLKP